MGNRLYKFSAVLTLLFVFSSAQSTSAAIVLRLERINNANSMYCFGLLKLALSYSKHKYEFDFSAESTSQLRAVENLNSGVTDVFWVGTSNELEEVLRPIRIPLYRGLLGYRILLISKGAQSRFDSVKSLEDLSRYSLGQGSQWPDTTILKSNGLNVVEILKYDSLFPMLDGGRFDAFPRGVHEPWSEIAAYPDLQIEVEKNLMLVYPMPFYFFVARDNMQLQMEIEEGLEKALADGEFEKYFFNNPLVRSVIEKADLRSRTVFRLNNPMLPKSTPIARKELWFDPLEL